MTALSVEAFRLKWREAAVARSKAVFTCTLWIIGTCRTLPLWHTLSQSSAHIFKGWRKQTYTQEKEETIILMWTNSTIILQLTQINTKVKQLLPKGTTSMSVNEPSGATPGRTETRDIQQTTEGRGGRGYSGTYFCVDLIGWFVRYFRHSCPPASHYEHVLNCGCYCLTAWKLNSIIFSN